MTIAHHVSGDLLLAYGAGALDEATSILVATHLALCPPCRAEVALAETIGGVLMDCGETGSAADWTVPEVAVAETGDLGEPHGPTPPPSAPTPATPSPSAPLRASAPCGPFVLPRPLRDYAGGDASELPWRTMGGGIRQMPLKTRGTGASARLLSIGAGKRVPEHGHGGAELTLVLAGALYDRDAWYRRGDVDAADSSVVHRPAAGPEGDCICLAVTDAPLKFETLIPRLLQPLYGI